MRTFSKVHVLGHLGQDPEVVTISDKTAATKFSVAVNDTWTDGEGRKHERVNWVPVIAWNSVGTNAAKYLRKGSAVLVEGSLRENTWTDKESGKSRSRLELVARDIIFLDRKPQDQPSQEPDEQSAF